MGNCASLRESKAMEWSFRREGAYKTANSQTVITILSSGFNESRYLKQLDCIVTSPSTKFKNCILRQDASLYS